MMRRGFILGDVHFPFHHKTILPLALYFYLKGQYDYFIQVGDLHDRYSASKFARSYNLFTPRDERKWCNYYAEILWGFVARGSAKERYQLLGNHCVRPVKRILEVAPEFEDEMLQVLHEDYDFEGVKSILDPREELYVDGICFLHGYLAALGKHAEYNLKNFVGGHTHRGGTVFLPKDGHETKQIWELNAGYVADPGSPGLSYTMQKRATRWTHGFGIIDQYGPRFVPLDPSMADALKADPLFSELYKAFGGI